MKDKIRLIIELGLEWLIGYGGMWVSKWAISSILTGYNTFAEALTAFMFRISNLSYDGTVKYSRIYCIYINIRRFIKTPIILLVMAYMVYCIFNVVKKKVAARSIVTIVIPYAILGVAPIFWYIFATNHSVIHAWFTNKECVISVMAVLFCCTDLKKASL